MGTRFMTALILAVNLLLSAQVLAQLQLPTFQSGDVLRANDLNRIVQQIRRNTTASGGSGGATHLVSCPVQSIAAVMSQTQPGDTIRISGTCNEAVVVDKDGITLDGGGSAVIDGSGIDLSVIAVIGRRNVTVRGLTVQNGLIGIHVGLGASAWLENVTARGSRSKAGYNSGHGILVANSSDAVLTGSIVANDNASHGIQVWQGGRASVVGNLVFEGSRLPQASLQANGNGVSGIDVGLGSSLQVQAPGGVYATVQTNDNGSNGIWLNNGSSAQFGGGADIEATGNGDTGLSVLTGSSAVFVAWADNSRGFTGTFNGNGRIGIQVWTHASLTTWDAGVVGDITAANNAKWGLLVDGVSTAFFGSPTSATSSKLILSGNGEHGALVVSSSSLTLRKPAEIKDNTLIGISAWGNSFIESGTAVGTTTTITGNGEIGIAAWNGASIFLVNTTVTGNAILDVEAGQGSRLVWYDSQVDTVYCNAGTLALGDAACP